MKCRTVRYLKDEDQKIRERMEAVSNKISVCRINRDDIAERIKDCKEEWVSELNNTPETYYLNPTGKSLEKRLKTVNEEHKTLLKLLNTYREKRNELWVEIRAVEALQHNAQISVEVLEVAHMGGNDYLMKLKYITKVKSSLKIETNELMYRREMGTWYKLEDDGDLEIPKNYQHTNNHAGAGKDIKHRELERILNRYLYEA
jgi:hypothetical protein